VILFVQKKGLLVHKNILLLKYKKNEIDKNYNDIVFLKKFVTFVSLEQNDNSTNLRTIFI